MRTIKWRCLADVTWQWLSGAGGNEGIPIQANDMAREGTITLPPQENYWYPCIALVQAQGGTRTTGNAYLRYFQRNGKDVVQALSVMQGNKPVEGPIDPKESDIVIRGGINLRVQLL